MLRQTNSMQRNNIFFRGQIVTVSQDEGTTNFKNKNMIPQLVGVPENLIIGNSLYDKAQ